MILLPVLFTLFHITLSGCKQGGNSEPLAIMTDIAHENGPPPEAPWSHHFTDDKRRVFGQSPTESRVGLHGCLF